ncbi:MAG TPA: DUF58 domain-containing protein [Mycobacteriales bacterium]|nr:DUF58 domain-containing protein [Mycobacteriales bacterium]
MRVQPGRAVAGAVAAAVLLHLLHRVTGGGWLALGSAATLALPVAALLLRPSLAGIEVRRLPSTAVRVGEEWESVVIVRNATARPSPPLQLHDDPRVGAASIGVPALAPGAEAMATLRRVASRRGVIEGSQVLLTTAAPFGLIRVRRDVEVPGRLVTHPAHVVPSTFAPDALATGVGERPRPVAGVGTEVLGIRPWRPGDPARALHARSSARHGRPVVLERERDGGGALVVLIDGTGSGPRWERAVAEAAALSLAALGRGRSPALLAAPPANAAPRAGTRRAVLDWFAGIDGAGPAERALVADAARAAGRGGTVVVVSASGDDAGLARVRQACASAGSQVLALGASGG